MQRYEAYKPSAIPWINELPHHWGEKKGKWLHRFRKELNIHMECDNVLSLTLRGVVNNDPDDPEGLVPNDYGTYQIFEKNDLVFKLIDLENLRTSRVGLVHERGIMSPAYLRVQMGRGHNPRYFYYYYFGLYQQGIYNKLGAGVRSTLSPVDLLDIGVPVPCRYEQDRIVAFLDQKIAEIDAAIAKKERLIDLLKEQKTALISVTTTRGLNRNVIKKDSGVEWIGSIPSHWSITSLGLVARIFAGGTPDRTRSKYWGGDIPWLKTGEVNFNRIRSAEEFITRAGILNSAAKIAPPDTLLMAMYGQGITRGRVGILDIPAAFNQACLGIIFGQKITTEFGFYFFYGAYSFLRDSGNETSQMNLSSSAISKFKIAIPPLPEQIAICNYLRDATKSIELAEIVNRKSIDALVNLKTCLVADVVSGKCKV